MNCSAGHQNIEGAAFCASCGLAMGAVPPSAPVPWPSATGAPGQWPAPHTSANAWPAPPPTPGFAGGQYSSLQRPQNGMGTAALVLGILGLLFGCLLGALAIVFGSIGISRANAGRANNKGAATTGLVLGIIGFVVWTLIFLASAGS